jgi:hypothetical protein
MPKPAKDLRLQGIAFEDAVKRMIALPVPPKTAPKKPAKIRSRKSKNG